MKPTPEDASPSPLLACCPSPTGLYGLGLDPCRPLDQARPCFVKTAPGALFTKDEAQKLAAQAGFSRPPVFLTLDPDAPPLPLQLRDRESPLPLNEFFIPPGRSPLSLPLPDGENAQHGRAAPGGSVLRLSTIEGMTGERSTGLCRAYIAGLFSLPGVAERSQRHGLTLLWLDNDRVFAALVFRDALHALAALSLPALSGPAPEDGIRAFIRALDDFRLGWLPDEEAERLGGAAWRAEELTDDAEGFKPLFAAGPGAENLANRARLMPDAPEHILCRGLLLCAGATRTARL